MIRLLALHDANGHIHGLVAAPADAPPAVPSVDGLLVSEVEAPNLDLDLGNPEAGARLAELMSRYQVDLRLKRSLVQRQDGPSERK